MYIRPEEDEEKVDTPFDFAWTLGDKKLEVVEKYKYLGVEETFRDNYKVFLEF